jgi:uncharacterized protein (DUF2062 family)
MAPLTWFQKSWDRILRVKATPHAVATGVALGVFFGFTPLWGLKTLLAMVIARLVRGSVLAAAISVTLHDVVLPLMPLLFRLEYQIGFWILSHPHKFPPQIHFHHHAQDWFRWSTFLTVGRPLLLGSVLVGLPFAFAAYFVTRMLIAGLKHEAALHGSGAAKDHLK